MDSAALLTVVGVAVVVLFIFLTALCLNCKGNSQPVYIRQYRSSEVSQGTFSSGIPQGFTVIRPYAEPQTFSVASTQHAQHQLITRLSACPSSDGGSQSDYINQKVDNDAVSYEQPPEKSSDFPDYLDVLPDDQNAPQPNVASSVNSGQSYQNDNDDDSDSQHYINVTGDGEPVTETPVGSLESCDSDGHGSSDYVNAPKHIN